MSGVVDRIDRFQERHPVVWVPLAGVEKLLYDTGEKHNAARGGPPPPRGGGGGGAAPPAVLRPARAAGE